MLSLVPPGLFPHSVNGFHNDVTVFVFGTMVDKNQAKMAEDVEHTDINRS